MEILDFIVAVVKNFFDAGKEFLYNAGGSRNSASLDRGVTRMTKYEWISLALDAGTFILALLAYLD